ncbi:NUDIX hydrolase [Georgenia thermotolerans]|uniref:NUDIX domain-containing protein n=1 Tax=Georgenia thermotolerans TaxID=527326 RepID=A0A7J5ULQ0_9MICO|nr:NUDIX domain-containing protein [Georgenia thermotolerans]KAE8763084.1 NUDIX domain-containing protein [Georgenia thermotolerans]
MNRFQVVPAAYVLLVEPARGGSADRVLLSLRRNTGYMDEHWSFGAAGHVEAGESVLAAAVREAREELGVELSTSDLEPLTVMHRTAGTGDPVGERVDFFFAAHTWTGRPERCEPHKAAALGWFALDDLPTGVVPHEREVLERLRTGNVPAVTVVGF